MINNLQNSPFHLDDVDSSAQTCIRAQPRHTAAAIRSSLGDVLDLSTGGARILTNAVPRSPVDVEFFAMNKSVTVRASIAWTRHTGSGFQTEIGLVFKKLTRTQRDTIESLSRGNMHRALL